MWIHEHKNWPNFTWDDAALIDPLYRVSQSYADLMSAMNRFDQTQREKISLDIIASDIVASSKIEGEILDKNAVRDQLAVQLGMIRQPNGSIDRSIESLVQIYIDVRWCSHLPLTQERLWGWHAALFPNGYSVGRRIQVATWREDQNSDMQIISHFSGRGDLHYVAPHSNRLPVEMDKFLKWMNADQSMNPYLKAGVSHFWFEAIHPFEDGNGRIGRAIIDLILAQSYEVPECYHSLSIQIQHERSAYYSALEQQQSLDLTPWLTWFIACLERSIINAIRNSSPMPSV